MGSDSKGVVFSLDFRGHIEVMCITHLLYLLKAIDFMSSAPIKEW